MIIQVAQTEKILPDAGFPISTYDNGKKGISKAAPNTETNKSYDYNLAIELAARQAVYKFESKRGRVTIEIPHSNQGYSIKSRNSLTGEIERYIEVKGVSREWNKSGVELSKMQFNNAQKMGDKFWLYVVEFVSDPENVRVYPIQNPANKVTSFIFDGNWRQVAEDHSDPVALFANGVKINHKYMGSGQITNIVTRGNTKLLTIHFDGQEKPTPNLTLNLHTMSVVEE